MIIARNLTEFYRQPKTVHNFLFKFKPKLAITLFYYLDLRALEVLITDSAKMVTLSGGVN